MRALFFYQNLIYNKKKQQNLLSPVSIPVIRIFNPYTKGEAASPCVC